MTEKKKKKPNKTKAKAGKPKAGKPKVKAAPKAKKPKEDEADMIRLSEKRKFTLTDPVGQVNLFEQAFGISRLAYNYGVALGKKRIEEKNGSSTDFISMRNEFNSIKREQYPFVLNVPKDVAAEAIRDATKAYINFFKSKKGARKGAKMGFPRFKKKQTAKKSFRMPTGTFKLIGEDLSKIGEISINKLGTIKLSDPINVKGFESPEITVSKTAGEYFVSVNLKKKGEFRNKTIRKPKSIGIDLGVKNLITLSNGVMVEGPKALKKYQKRLRRQNRALARKKLVKNDDGKTASSKNREKAKALLAKTHARIANIRKDALEKKTTEIARKYDVVCVENLNVKGMMKLRSMAKGLSDQSFSRFVTRLEQKQLKYGFLLAKVGRFYASSKTCFICKVKKQDLKLSDRIFHCDACGHEDDRDFNAAKNIQFEALKDIYPSANGDSKPVEIGPLLIRTVQTARMGKSGRRSRNGTADPGPPKPSSNTQDDKILGNLHVA